MIFIGLEEIQANIKFLFTCFFVSFTDKVSLTNEWITIFLQG